MITLNIVESLSTTLEYLIILGVIIFQIYYFNKVRGYINVFGNIFTKPLLIKHTYISKDRLIELKNNGQKIAYADLMDDIKFTEESGININDYYKIAYVDTDGSNEVMKRIVEAINDYLLNNYGASVNFSIIKDIIDREVDVKDEEINQAIPTPLYTGLAATMIGIIFGLFSMPNIGGNVANAETFSGGIDALINGVKVAMFASLTGLTLTTLLSAYFYKRTKRIAIRDKNKQISFLQAELLPELLNAEESGISGLKHSLDKFSRDALNIAEKMDNAARITSDNLDIQHKVIEKVEKLKMSRMSKANLEIFEKLDKSMDSLKVFVDVMGNLENISQNLNRFAERTNNTEQLIQDINQAMRESRDISSFLSNHLAKIDEIGGQALRAVDLADYQFQKAIDRLQKEMQERILNMNIAADNHENQLKDIYDEIGNRLKEVTQKHIQELEQAYHNAVPKFEQLEHLSELNPIKESIEEKSDLLKHSNKEISELAEELRSIKQQLKQNKNINKQNDELLKSIKSIGKSGSGKGISVFGKTKYLEIFELILKILGWSVVVSFGIHSLLQYYEIMP